ncbi:hypothetical protein [Miniphocaeibacter halophilus]|uniref:Uncharacterized protein n=1 Tax=Miniphocaeibacter halophilus TaxID=2931922 RepID=A0AC61MSS6_9FIRM|nr:hypothetical protein [Miniphocaeibacter halophilus]QQK08622.1 hypothetical protein JFY71_03515 [Miniphocaeibacter halophilus]
MKSKGYISVFALVVSILVFTLITVILVGVDLENNVNKNQKDYYQNCLISESIANKIKSSEEYNSKLNEIFSKIKNTDNKETINVNYNEILNGGNITANVSNYKENKFIINYNLEYKNTYTSSSITYSLKDNPLLNDDELIEIQEDDENYKLLLDNDFEKIVGDIVFFKKSNESYYIEFSKYNELVEEYQNSEDEEVDFNKLLVDNGIKIEEDKLYFINADLVTIIGNEDINVSAVFVNNKLESEGGVVNLKGILINNNEDSNSFNVEGKVVENIDFKGHVKYNKKILEEIINLLEIEEEYIWDKFWIM